MVSLNYNSAGWGASKYKCHLSFSRIIHHRHAYRSFIPFNLASCSQLLFWPFNWLFLPLLKNTHTEQKANAAVTFLILPSGGVTHLRRLIQSCVYCVREPHLHALFTCPSPHFAAVLGHFELTSAPSSVSQSWGLLADKSEEANCLARIGIGLFSVHAHQNFCTHR